MNTGTNLKPERSQKLSQLLASKTLSGMATPAAFDHVAQLIDLSFDLNNLPGLEHAIALVPELVARELRPEEQALLHYFEANAWANTRHLKRKGQASQWEWEQEEFEKEIISLRSALRSEGFSALGSLRQCQILTNLANALNHIGRSVEAIEYWDRALHLNPNFGMARGNRGHGLIFYASLLEHLCHQVPFLKEAYRDLKTALTLRLEPGAAAVFRAALARVQGRAPVERLEEAEADQDDDVLGATPEEMKYRSWCLRNRLFLNTANDLGPRLAAARDNLTTPSIVVKIKDEVPFFAFFNQIKQEFVSARFSYFEGTTCCGPHYSDKDVLLYNTFDYPTYSLAIERTKSAFRTLYSLFDKIAFFLNQYLELSIPERQTTFRTFWYVGQTRKKGLRPELQQRRNWPLRGLFWLSKDLYEDKPGFHETIEPDAQELAIIRNHLEHKYLRVQEYTMPPSLRGNQVLSLPSDPLSYSVGRRDFEAKTLRLLKILRAALIYLSLAIFTEERFRSQERDGNLKIPVLPAHRLRDDFKI